jgi:hypothetical protein
MKADYDSEADAISIDLRVVDGWDGGDQVDDDYCNVAFAGGDVVNVELLNPAEHLDLLDEAAKRYDLDALALRAAAAAALAAPDHPVTVEVGPRAAGSTESLSQAT